MNSPKEHILAENAKSEDSIKVDKPCAVFVGGTSGVGEGSAYAFARHTKNATVYIIGRNTEAGERIVQKLQQIQPSGSFHFIQSDLSLLENAKAAALEILAKESKINVLCLTAGTLRMSREKSAEDIPVREAVCYYSRWMVIDQLLPLVSKAAELNEPARINNIFGPHPMALVDADNVHKSGEKITEFVRWCARMHNIVTEKYATLHPNIAWMHTYPGLVNTDIMRDLPWYVRYVSAPVQYFWESIDSCGERMHYVNYVSDQVTNGAHFYHGKLKDLREEFLEKGWLGGPSQDLAYDALHKVLERF